MDQRADRFASEVPVNLPRNRAEPEYGSDLICDLLQAMGFEHVMLTPGSSFRGLHDSLVNHTRNATPEIILCGAEEIALHMAQGYSKVTGKASLVILHDLVGLQHAMMAFYNAWADEVPILVLGGSGPADPAERRAIDWLHSANTQCESVRPYTKWTDEPGDAEGAVRIRAQGAAHRREREAGARPMSRSMPGSRRTGSTTRPRSPMSACRATARRRRSPRAESEIAAAADLLTGASMPLVFGGRFGRHAEAGPPLVRLIELLGAAYQDGTDIGLRPDRPSAEPERRLPLAAQPDPQRVRRRARHRLPGSDRAGRRLCRGARRYAERHHRLAQGHRSVGQRFGRRSLVERRRRARPARRPAPRRPAARARPAPRRDRAPRAGRAAWYGRAQERRKELAERHEKLRGAQRERAARDWDAMPISVPRVMGELWQAVRSRDWGAGEPQRALLV